MYCVLSVKILHNREDQEPKQALLKITKNPTVNRQAMESICYAYKFNIIQGYIFIYTCIM